MANLSVVLKDEISRVARKEIRREIAQLRKATATHRTEIAALKRRAVEAERQLRRFSKSGQGAAAPAANDEPTTSTSSRFSAKSLASQRRRLGLSAAEVGLLLGASAQSIYNWEDGKSRPRTQHMPAIFALRKLGKREANAHLDSLKAA